MVQRILAEEYLQLEQVPVFATQVVSDFAVAMAKVVTMYWPLILNFEQLNFVS
jgi:hypothetical protein